MPAIERRIVVLPQPEGPSRVKNVPLGTSRSTPRTAATAPKCFSSPSTRSDISAWGLVRRWSFRRRYLLLEPRGPFGAVREDIRVVDLGQLFELGTVRDAGLGGGGQLDGAVHDRIAVGLGSVF